MKSKNLIKMRKILTKTDRSSGITLIALVITIIVLLILAGVSIAMLTGENGILTQAQKAKEETENAARQEEENLVKLEAMINGEDIVIVPVDDDNPGELEQEGADTFVINSIEDLVFFSYDVTINGTTYEGKTVKLGTNLDFNSDKSYVNPNRTDFGKYGYNGSLKQALTTGTGFSPIGELLSTGTNYFYGTFDGNNNAICSLFINVDEDESVRAGLFSTCYGEVKNLGLVNENITVQGLGTAVGGITGRGYKSIYNCYVIGNINVTGSSWMPVGGLCGAMQEESNIENCYNLANINVTNTKEDAGDADIGCGGILGQGNANINKCYNKGNIVAKGGNNTMIVGGVCGYLNNGSLKNSYNSAEINIDTKTIAGSTTTTAIGGIIGEAFGKMDIINCYNSGEIICKAVDKLIIGGIVAYQRSDTETRNVFNVGKITTEDDSENLTIGGILGMEDGGSVSNSYNIGIIDSKNENSQSLGSIIGIKYSSKTVANCYFLTGTYSVGLGYNNLSTEITGIKELQDISEFPSMLSVVNEDKAFKEDTYNINNGDPILYWQ